MSFIFQDEDDTDDCYAEIMNDDIIKLDETLLADDPQLLSIIPDQMELKRGSDQLSEPVDTTQVLPFQGTANRRIRLKKTVPRRISYPEECMSSDPPKYVTKSMHNQLIFLFVIVLTLFILFLLFGRSESVKNVTHSMLYHDF